MQVTPEMCKRQEDLQEPSPDPLLSSVSLD